MDLSGLLSDIVGGAELDICFFEVGFYTTQVGKREMYQHRSKRRKRLGRNPMGLNSRVVCGWRKGAGVRGGDGAEDLASACVVEVDLVGLLECGELGAGFRDGEGVGHG